MNFLLMTFCSQFNELYSKSKGTYSLTYNTGEVQE